MKCPTCENERVHVEFTDHGLVAHCECGTSFPQVDEDVEDLDSDEDAPERPVRKNAAVAASKPSGLTERDIVRQAKTELKLLDVEIKRLKQLEQRRDAIRRLLAAAKPPKQQRAALVRAIRG